MVLKYQRLCPRGSLLAAAPALAELRMCPSSAEAAPGRFCHRTPHQQNQELGTNCISSCSRCPSGFQGPCPEQETSKSLPGRGRTRFLARSPACSQPGKAIKGEEQTDLSRELREKAAAIWSWRKQEHNPVASIPCCLPLLPRVPPAPSASELSSWSSLGCSPIPAASALEHPPERLLPSPATCQGNHKTLG